MENTNEIINIDTNLEPVVAEVPTTETNDEYEVFELNDEEAFNHLRQSRGLEFESIDEFLTPREKIVEKEVNPYADVLDDDDKAYLNYKKETGRSRKDYEKLNSNLDEISKVDLARELVRKESGLNLSDETVNSYLLDEYGIDVEDMSASDEIKLAKITKSILEDKKSEQEKYKKPVDKSTQNKTENEYVQLDDNSIMLRSDYEKLESNRADSEKNRLAKIQIAKQAVNSVTTSNFEIDIDDNGTVRKENYAYDYSEQDKQSMVSIVSNIDSAIEKTFGSNDSFDHQKLAKAIWLADDQNMGKMVASLLHKAIAGNTEEVLKQRGNVNFTSNNPLQTQTREGVKNVPINSVFNK